MNDNGGKYKNVIDCIIKTAAQDGIMAFYKGFIPNYLRLGSHCFLTLPLYEFMRRSMGMTSL